MSKTISPQRATLALTLALLTTTALRAEPIYEYRFERPDYTALNGQSIPIRVYLQETATVAESRLKVEGLFSAGVQLTVEAPSSIGVVTPANPFMGFPDPNATAQSKTLFETISPGGTGVPGSSVPGQPGKYRVFLGTFWVTGLGMVGDEMILTLADRPGLDETLTAWTGTVLDSKIQPVSTTIAISDVAPIEVPEPGTLWLLLSGVAGGLLWCRRRRSG